MKYESPEFSKKAFTCPHCDAYANMVWNPGQERAWTGNGYGHVNTGIQTATCAHCLRRTIWFENDGQPLMVWPSGFASAPLPHEEMPGNVKSDYLEARLIVGSSPRGSAALLRLALQKLCVHLGEAGKNINDDIACLVKKGLPVQIQQALDIVRVTGNNAVHPGELRLEDSPETAAALFGLVNLVVDNRIAEPARIKKLYESLPAGARDGVEKRDR